MKLISEHRSEYFSLHFCLTLDFLDDNENDSEEINELSRLQDQGNQDSQVGGAITEAEGAKSNPTIDNSMVPSDQNQSASDTLASISDFLKSREGESASPGRQDQHFSRSTFSFIPIYEFDYRLEIE